MIKSSLKGVKRPYIARNKYTDLRREIDGLAQIVQQQFELDPFSNSLFLFCGKCRDRIKALLWEGTDSFSCISEWITSGGSMAPAAVPRCIV